MNSDETAVSLAQLRGPAEQRLAASRRAGDKRAEALALSDLGALLLRQRETARAVNLLQEALKLSRQLGEPEGDLLGNLGLALLRTDKPQQALDLFDQEQSLALAAADRFAEKLALEHLARGNMVLGNHAVAVTLADQAIALARELGDLRHEAELLWLAAVLHADQGQRDQAIANGQAAIAVMHKMEKPEAAWFAEHLDRYSRETDPERVGPMPPQLPTVFVASAWQLAPNADQSPKADGRSASLLRMALSAGTAMAKFVGSGFQIVQPSSQQQRLQVCKSCEHHTGLRCRLCGCFTSFKTRFPYEQCPIGKWPAENPAPAANRDSPRAS
jgi:tetratricopeptide (TPR) repeat protein